MKTTTRIEIMMFRTSTKQRILQAAIGLVKLKIVKHYECSKHKGNS